MTNTSAYSKEYQAIRDHPYVRSLVASGKYVIEHAYDVPDDMKEHSLTAGTLIFDGGISHTPVNLRLKQEIVDDTDTAELIVFYFLGPKLCGHKGIIHGGLLATLVDESFCRCGFALLPSKRGVTASLELQYKAPTRANSFVIVHSKTTKHEGRKVWVEGSVKILPPANEYTSAEELIVTVDAKILAVEPRWASKLDSRIGKSKEVLEGSIGKDTSNSTTDETVSAPLPA
jgi:acyl-coenzyme A thioesterase PaaI-like protein